MTKKLKYTFIDISLIGNKILKSFYLAIKCQITKKVFKSPIIYGGTLNKSHEQKDSFWSVLLYEQQNQVNCKLIFINQNQEIVQVLSQAVIEKQIYLTQKKYSQKQLPFYAENKKIAVLLFKIQQTVSQTQNVFNSRLNEQQQYLHNFSYTNMKQHDIDDQQNQRHEVQHTLYKSPQNSVFHDKSPYSNDNDVFLELNQSSIQQRHPFSLDDSLMFSENLSINKENKQISSCLQKWIKKLNKVENQNQSSANSIQFQTIIPQQYKNSEGINTTKLLISSLKLNQQNSQTYSLESLSLTVLSNQQKQQRKPKLPFLQSKFSLCNQNEQEIQGKVKKVKQLKLKNFLVQIPENQNLQVQIILYNPNQNNSLFKIQGIFIKDKALTQDKIPLFLTDQVIFASLQYKIKKLQNVSVQSLPPLPQIQQDATQQQQQFKDTDHQNQAKQQKKSIFEHSMKQKRLNLGYKKKYLNMQNIRQRHISMIQNNQIAKIKRQQNSKDLQYLVNQQKIQAKTNQNSPSNLGLQRSNTQNIPYFQLQTQSEDKSSNGSKNISNFRQNLLKLNSQTTGYTLNPILSGSPRKISKQSRLMQSTNIRDSSSNQRYSQYDNQQYFQGDTFKIFDESSNSLYTKSKPHSPIKNMKHKRKFTEVDEDYANLEYALDAPSQVTKNFIVQINSVTVILYQRPSLEEQQIGKFLILKSDQGQNFITQTLFDNHLNLNWKNKHYQFAGSQIVISLYQRTGRSSQCQNKLMGKSLLKFVDLMKGIKQNFFRVQIQYKYAAVGTIIVMYDIFMEKHSILNQKRKNMSQMKINYRIDKLSRSINRSQLNKEKFLKNQNSSTLKTTSSKPKNRKRAKTLQSNFKSVIFPSINKNSSPSRRSKLYQGGKNIKIGRAERFTNSNAAETIGEV